MSTEAKCPFHAAPQAKAAAPGNASWWPEQLKLNILRGILSAVAPGSGPRPKP